MERLQPGRPPGNNDFTGRGIHPAILAACVTGPIPAHSLLRFVGEPISQTKPGALPALAGYAGSAGANRPVAAGQRLPRPLRGTHRPFALPMPSLWARPHAGRCGLTEIPVSLRAAHRLLMIGFLPLSKLVTDELASASARETCGPLPHFSTQCGSKRPNQRFFILLCLGPGSSQNLQTANTRPNHSRTIHLFEVRGPFNAHSPACRIRFSSIDF